VALLAVAAALVLLAGVAFAIILWRDPGGEPDPVVRPEAPQGTVTAGSGLPKTGPPEQARPAAGRAQAQEIDGLLDSMASSREQVSAGVQEASDCSGLSLAVSDLEEVEADRADQLGVAESLEVYALDDGQTIKDTLVRSLEASLDADTAYRVWAESWLGCTGGTPLDADYERGQSISENRATPAKAEFARLWRPVAREYGLSPRDADEF
jgi:hypothetical protein